MTGRNFCGQWRLLGWTLACAIGIALLILWLKWPTRSIDMTAILHLHNRGVGLMEQFQFDQAAEVFEEIVAKAPDWRPGRINLGIALLNTATPANLERAARLFENLLQQEPDNLYAHYCLGIIHFHAGHADQAAHHFEVVTTRDPQDAHAWYFLGNTQPPNSPQAKECYRKALELNPYLSGALYGLAMALRQDDRKEAEALLAKHKALTSAQWESPSGIRYKEMGRHAEVIGKTPTTTSAKTGPLPLFAPADKFRVELAPGTRWAKDADFAKETGGGLRTIRRRFGGTMVVLDYDRDGRLDVLMLGAVARAGHTEDLLLHNEGDGLFRDVTAATGLGGPSPNLGCCVADFDNDGFPDLLRTGDTAVKLARNVNGKMFEDVTITAGLGMVQGALGAAFVDIDQDGDLDLVLCSWTEVDSELPCRLNLYLNVGEAVPAPPGKAAPLKAKFRWAEEAAGWPRELLTAVNLAVSDIDEDGDLDVIVLAKDEPLVIRNDRLLKFQRTPLTDKAKGTWNGALVLDSRRADRSDLFLVGPGQKPLLLVHDADLENRGERGQEKRYKEGWTNAPPLLQAQAVDVDADGWPDVVGLSEQRRPVLLHNDGQRLVVAPEALGRDADWPADVQAVAMADVDGDGFPDLLVWSAGQGLHIHRNLGNGNQVLPLTVSGRRDQGTKLRCNADGFGARVIAQAGDLWTGGEWTTLSAGLGQSRQPLYLGLGKYPQADVLRLRWPDGTWQAELNLPAGQLAHVAQINRTTISCPLLFAWNGQRFGFIGDFLGEGSMGECLPGGGHRQPRPEESVKIEAHQLSAKDGRFLIKIGEPMDEATYLDRLQLVVVDHPQTMRVYPDERFDAAGKSPSQDLLVFARDREIYPLRALDHKGNDVTAQLRHWDRQTVDRFAQRSWLGLAEEHGIELDLADCGLRIADCGLNIGNPQSAIRNPQSVKDPSPLPPLFLFLAGWTDYPYPESIWAAEQAGVTVQPPRLERLGGDGRWQEVPGCCGFPAGLPRLMALDMTGQLGGPSCRLRLRTNMHIYWDQVFAAPLLERIPAGQTQAKTCRVTPLEVYEATLEVGGCMQEFSPDGRLPTLYDYHRREAAPVTRLSGQLTRLGDVAELLRQRDDCFVIFGPGEEISVAFDATGLPPLPPGWTRSFVLRTWGYCKDCSPFTATGGTVEPLPFRGMSRFPYGTTERYPNTARHEDYLRRFQTRRVGTR